MIKATPVAVSIVADSITTVFVVIDLPTALSWLSILGGGKHYWAHPTDDVQYVGKAKRVGRRSQPLDCFDTSERCKIGIFE